MAPSASDVPTRYDVLINGAGYVYYDPWTVGSSTSAPEKAVYSFTPPFVERQNTQGDYGDNQQDFWLTFSQKDWSLGEGQRHEGQGEEAKRKYWSGTAVDIRKAGQVTIDRSSGTISSFSPIALTRNRRSTADRVQAADATNAYLVKGDGTTTSLGAHDLGTSPNAHGLATDGTNLFVCSDSTVSKIRKFDGVSWSTFNTNIEDAALEYHNNSLYALDIDTLYSLDTSGTETALFTWNAAGHSYSTNLCSFGGKLIFGFANPRSELWMWDGTGASQIAEFPPNFVPWNIVTLSGVAFVSGNLVSTSSGGETKIRVKPAVYYYANGSPGLLWKSDSYCAYEGATIPQAQAPAIIAHDECVVWNDDATGRFMRYDIASGAISSFLSYTTPATPSKFTVMASGLKFFVYARDSDSTSSTYFPSSNTVQSTATISSSLADFNLHLTKIFRGIKVEFDSASDGDFGSVDIAYRVGDVGGSYTTLQTGAVSGTEYTLSSVTGSSISVKITLNKGTSTNGPVLKRIYVRAVAVQPSFRLEKYVLDNTGRAETGVNDPEYITLRDDTTHNLDGLQMATALRTAYNVGTTISLTDKFGTFTGVIEELKQTEIRPNEFVSEVTVREV